MTVNENSGVSRRDWLKVAGAAGLAAAAAGEGGSSLAEDTTSGVTKPGSNFSAIGPSNFSVNRVRAIGASA